MMKSAPPGGGAPHIDDGVADARQGAAGQGGEHPGTLVDRQQGGQQVGHQGGDDHAPQGFDEEIPADEPEAEEGHRDVEEDGGHADGQPPEAVADHGDAGKAGHGEPGVEGEVINPHRDEEAPRRFPGHVGEAFFPGHFVGSAPFWMNLSPAGERKKVPANHTRI